MKFSSQRVLATIAAVLIILFALSVAFVVVILSLHKFPTFTIIMSLIITIVEIGNVLVRLCRWLLEKLMDKLIKKLERLTDE